MCGIYNTNVYCMYYHTKCAILSKTVHSYSQLLFLLWVSFLYQGDTFLPRPKACISFTLCKKTKKSQKVLATLNANMNRQATLMIVFETGEELWVAVKQHNQSCWYWQYGICLDYIHTIVFILLTIILLLTFFFSDQ